MSEHSTTVTPIEIVNEVEQSYLNYAMSVIAGRALPDCRDGLKPVHRRILYAMNELKNYPSKPHKKSARIVGDVQAKYHPHGESAIYEAIVRMAQTFSMRHLIVDGQGNFGSVDGDAAAAMRYTEVRLKNYALAIMEDLEKETVNFSPNYDGTEKIPDVMPTKIPNYLINGTNGIAVGMATQVPPHNLEEVMQAFLYFIRNPQASVPELMQFIKGPDFPTGGTILGLEGIKKAYMTGKGRFFIRAVSHFETLENQKTAIVITELPYQVNKAKLVEKIAQLAREKKIEGCSALRDESDKEGMRIVIEVKKEANEKVLLNQLINQTQLQISFNINMIGLINNQPRTLSIPDILKHFLKHRQEIIVRKTRFDLNKNRHKAHTLEGLSLAIDNLEEILTLIKSSQSSKEAKEKLLEKSWSTTTVSSTVNDIAPILVIKENLPYGLKDGLYQLSEKQAESILEMKLQKLTSMERDKIKIDYANCISEVRLFLDILNSEEKRLEIIEEESQQMIKQFQDPRRTTIDFDEEMGIIDEDLITPEEKVVTLSQSGYIKVQSLDAFENQNRGGKGKSALKLKEEDKTLHLLIANSHDHILFFTSAGRVYKKRVFELPQASRTSLGKPIINYINISKDEVVTAILPLKNFDPNKAIMFVTQRGKVKKVSTEHYANIRTNGLITITLEEEDSLSHAFLVEKESQVMLVSKMGKAVFFTASNIRCMGRTAMGVMSMKLADKQDSIVSAFEAGIQGQQDRELVIISSLGYGKRMFLSEYRLTSHRAQGSFAMKCSDKTGPLVGAALIKENDNDLMFMTKQGILLRTGLDNIRQVKSRGASGVRLIKLQEDDAIASFELCPAQEEDNEKTESD